MKKQAMAKIVKISKQELSTHRVELNFQADIQKFLDEVYDLGDKIRDELELPIAEMEAQNSKFFKEVYLNTPRIWKRRKNV